MKPVCCEVLPLKEGEKVKKGLFLGLVDDEGGNTAVVAHDDYGMMLSLYHPSRVRLTPGEP